MRHVLHILLASTAATSGALGTMRAYAAEYSLTPLTFTPQGINNAGQITGYAGINGSIPCVWTPGPGGGTLTNLPTSAHVRQGLAINSLGQISGLGGEGTTALWMPGAAGYSLTNIGDVNPLLSENIWATGINDSGAVVGAAYDFSGGGWNAFLWKPTLPNGTAGTMVSLGKLADFAPPVHTINNKGQIALTNSNHALLWNPASPNGTTGTMYDLGSLSGPTGTSQSKDINSKGQIVGISTVGATSHAFLWSPNSPNGVTGSMIDLGDLPGDQAGSKAFAINSAGTIVGKSGEGINSAFAGGNAIIWTAGNGPQKLNDLLDQSGSAWQLTDAIGINDQGWIIGMGFYDPDGPGGALPTYSPFLLTPAPEPATLSLMLFGAATLCTRRHCRRRQ